MHAHFWVPQCLLCDNDKSGHFILKHKLKIETEFLVVVKKNYPFGKIYVLMLVRG